MVEFSQRVVYDDGVVNLDGNAINGERELKLAPKLKP